MGILSGETPVTHAGHGESTQTAASAAGICARGEPCREEVLLSALLGTERPCPKQGAGTLGSWSPPSPRLHHHLHPHLLPPFPGWGGP